jgi:hypothetical protein
MFRKTFVVSERIVWVKSAQNSEFLVLQEVLKLSQKPSGSSSQIET